ncbi:MAG TPA: hypothetical protein VFF52_00290, partial [Isosphaeraceae bacterium]|nr:hypothetical protein [Isosphaeraceae bacterium]
SLPEKLFAHQALEPTPLDQLVPGLPEGLAEVVRRMMRKGPDERYATPTLLAQALEPYTDEYAAISGRADAGRPLPGPRPETEPGDPSGAALAGAPTVHSSASPAPRSEEIEAGAAPRIAAAAGILPRSGGDLPHSAALSPGGAGLDQPEVPLLTPVDEPAVPLLTPIDETDATSQDVPLNVDLGPEPSLSAGMARSKPRFLSVFPLGTGSVFLPGEPGSNSSTAEGPAWWPAAGWLWGLIVLAALATVVIVLYGLAGALRPTAPVAPESRTRHEAGSDRARAAAADRPSRSGGAPPAILLRTPGREEDPAEEGIPAEDPIQAIRTAISSGRYVELRNREPLRLPPGQTLNFESASGSLIIRAARGCTPVLDIELNGSRPLVTTGSNVSVELSGLTILVRYPRSGAGSAPAPPPVIRSAGKRTKIERCAFAVAGRAGCHDSCAIVADGGSLLVNRCWLQGFDRAIEVSAYLGALARIHQTMIVPAPARPLTMGGWSVTVKALGSGGAGTRTPQRLILDHCTVEAAGLLDLAGGPSPPDLEVEVKHCAIRTAALVAWKRNPLATGQVRWFGEGNQYDIRGRAWIVPAAGSGPVTATSPTDVTDLESWSKVAARESQPIRTTLVYRTDPAARADPLRPRDFAIADLGSASTAVGADPDQVGPWGR